MKLQLFIRNKLFLLILFSLFLQSCTAWPSIVAMLSALSGGKGGGGGILVPPGGGGSDSASNPSTSAAVSSCMASAAAGTPQVIGINSDKANGSYKAGTVIKILVQFSEGIAVTGTPTLLLNNTKVISYSGTVSTTTILNDTAEFSYTVGALEDIAPLDYKDAASLVLSGGTIKSTTAPNKDALTTLNPPGTVCNTSLVKNKTINIDTKSPSITSITTTMNDGAANVYGNGANITIDVTFDEIVSVTGTPTLTVNTGGTANYTSGTGTNTLRFTYTVSAGHATTDLNVTAFNSAGANIVRDVASNDSNTALPATANLANNKDVNVDANLRTISFSTASSNAAESTTTINIPVSISSAPISNATVDYSVTGGTATGGGTDFTFTAGTLTFIPAGPTTQNISFTVNNDAIDELNETVIITLASPSASALGANSVHTYTINDDDPTPTIGFDVSAPTSGNESTTSVNLPVTISAASGLPITVDYSVTGGTATGGGTDYTLGAGTLSFPAGTTLQNIVLTINNDALNELNETLTVTLANPSNSTLATNTLTYTINDDDAVPSLSIDSRTTTEGNSGSTNETFTVTLSAASGRTITVDYATANGTATAGADYTAIGTTTLTFNPGDISKTITVAVTGDAMDEADETYTVNLSNVSASATIATATGTGTITDDDNPPTVQYSTASANGSEATATNTVTVQLSSASAKTITVDYSVTGGTATGTGTDYTLTNGTLTFTPGQTSKTFDITIVNDTIPEANETIILGLSNAVNTTISGNTAYTYTINDNDTPTIAFNATASSGAEATTAATIPVTLSVASTVTVTVDYAVQAASTATGGGTDYTLANGTLTFNAGTTTQNISVTVNNDTLDENDETIVILLSNPANSTLGANTTHTYTINDDDDPPTISISSPSLAENNSGVNDMAFVVTLSAPSAKTITVYHSTADGTATAADNDYVAIPSSILTFTPGQTSKNVDVVIKGDTKYEANETLTVTLVTPTNATIATATGTGTITNDDTAPTVSFDSASSNGSEAVTAVTIPVSLSAASGQSVTVGYAVNGSSTATGGGTDYTLASGTLTFNPGTTTQNISITVVNDTATELNETIIVDISSPTNATLGATTAHTYTINDNDGPTVAFNATTSNGSESVTAVTIPVSLSAAYGTTVTVDYAVSGGTATGGGTDFTLASGSLTFTPGTTSQNISVTVVNDTATELNETIQVTLSNPTGATLGTNTVHTYTITDNDPPFIAFDATTSNGSEATSPVTIPVSISAAYGSTITVNYAVNGGSTATGGGTDYSLASGTLTFNPGTTTQNISLTIINDTTTEVNETVSIDLSSPSNANLGTNTTHTYTINDNDPPTVAFTGTTSSGSESVTAVTIPVSLSTAYGSTVTVDYAVTGGTATGSGTDFTLASGSLSFSPGTATQNISVTVVNDTLNEADETIIVTLSNPSNSSLGTNTSHTYTITNDDTAPTVQFASASSSSGDESSATRSVTVSLSAAAGQDVTVIVTDVTGVGTGLATSGTDFTPIGSPLTLTFTAGTTTQTVDIPVIQDLDYEGNEVISLTLSSPTIATLGAQTTHTFTITDDDIGILSAETMDIDSNGKIDHYKITFSEAVLDSTFPGYSSNALGAAQSNWRIGGTTAGVVLSHGTAENPLLADTANDAVIYLKFNESGVYDTDSKPELTTFGSPGLTTAASKTVGSIYTATVTEADRAKPVIVSASGTTAGTNLTVTFSEPVWGASGMPACGSGGSLTAAALTYVDTSGNGANSLTSMGSDSCGTDSTAIFSANTSFISNDNGSDTVAGNTNLFDAANNTGNTKTLQVSVTDPIITSIQQFDTNKNGKIDQLLITFSIPMNDSTIDDADAVRFLVGGFPAAKVDTASSGTGVIASPNTDPGTANDNIITIFTDDSSVSGTDLKTVSFTTNPGRWLGNNGVALQSIASLSSVTVDKAPPVILTAVASDNSNLTAGVDSDDTLVLTFSESTNKPTINTANISTIFSLNNSHAWGTITSATWNAAGDSLTLLFAGSGSTVAVGDTITILGTVADNAASPNTSVNIAALNPISGSFYSVDTSTPTVVSATSINATTVRITYSKAMNVANSTTAANYKIVTSPGSGLCSDNTNFSGGTSVLSVSSVAQVDTKTFDLTTATQSASSYTLVVNKSGVNDFQPVSLNCPNNADFTGNEDIKAASAVCANTTEVVFAFSKPVKTGINAANSAECNTTVECAKRYYITPATVGSITSVKALDGVICGGAPINSSKVCITHTTAQGGGNYTIIAANNTDGDGFDNSTWGGIQNSTAPVANLQAAPKDRVSFTGCGAGINNFTDGPISTDPFGDNAYFGYVMSYFNKIYIGPNTNGNAASRFNPDGSSPETMSFQFTKDTSTANSTSTSSSPATTRDGSIAVPPYVTIGHTGCTATGASTAANIATGCGPNGENGRGLFASGIVSGTEYLFITGARSGGNDDYLYYTSDTDTTLNFSYLDASATFNSATISGNSGTESIIVMNNKVYWMSPGNRSARPYLVKINTLTQDQASGTDSVFMNIRYMKGFGGAATTNPNNADKIGGTLFEFNSRVYLANSGSNSTDGASCDAGTSYSAGVCEQTGGIIRSKTNDPAACTSAANCLTVWDDITPSATKFKQYFSIVLLKLADIIPSERPIPGFASFNSKLYMIRNACTTRVQKRTCNNAAPCADDIVCPSGSEVPQLWKCDPTNGGADVTNPTTCESAEWSLVAENGSTGKTNMNVSTNKKVSILVKNGSQLYVGYDNDSTGIQMWRTKTGVTNPTSESDFEQAGTNGFGDPTNNLELYSAVSLEQSGFYYVYVSTGRPGSTPVQPVRVYRQVNGGPLAFAEEPVNYLLAYINQGENNHYTIGLIALVLAITAYLATKKFRQKGTQER